MSTKKKTSLNTFYHSRLRPQKNAEGRSQSYLQNLDLAVVAADRWRPAVFCDEIDSSWLDDFRRHLSASPRQPGTVDVYVRHVRHIARQHSPYRFVRGMRWPEAAKLFRAEAEGYFGNFYVTVFEPRHRFEPATLRAYRNDVRRFYQWYGAPLRLADIDDALLDRFRADEKKRMVKPAKLEVNITFIRRVVNEWQPKRLRMRSEHPRPRAWSKGTVQHFVETVVIPDWQFRSCKIGTIRVVMERLYEFRARKALLLSQFDADVCESYLRWRLAHGHESKSLTVKTVNNCDRWILNTVSQEAVAKGLIRRPLRLDMLRDSGRPMSRYQYKTSGYRRASSGHITSAAESIGKPNWDARSGELKIGGERRPVASQAAHVRKVLDLFQADGWPERIESPFNEPQTHHNTIKKLNQRLELSRFYSLGSGTQIGWKIEKVPKKVPNKLANVVR